MSHKTIHHLLKDGTRRRIIEFLGSKEGSTYTEILAELGISTGKLNYHLRLLSPLLERSDQHYSLNELGSNALTLLKGLAPKAAIANGEIYRILSWLLLSLSLLAMYYGFVIGSLLSAVLEFFSTALLIVSIFSMYLSRNYEFKLRHVFLLALVGLAYGGPALLLYILSNPIRAEVQVAFTPLVNSLIFFPTLLAWSLHTRREWVTSALTVSSLSLVFLAGFTLALAVTGHLADLFNPQPTLNCVKLSAGGSSCSALGIEIAIPLTPLFMLLTIAGRIVGLRTLVVKPA